MILTTSGLATAPIVAAIAALAIIALLVVWLLPRRQARRWSAEGIEGRELAELENGARATLVQILGGVALILTFGPISDAHFNLAITIADAWSASPGERAACWWAYTSRTWRIAG